LLSKASAGYFGRGIYSTSTSYKSHSYNSGTESALGSGTRAMLVVSVVAGRAYQATSTDSSLTAAPSGYDCVVGSVASMGGMDELIVYKEEAVLPKYIVIYTY